MRLKTILLNILPILRFRIQEESMIPSLTPGTTVLVNKIAYLFKDPCIHDLVIVQGDRKKHLVKRISKIKKNKYFVLGDNIKKSIDSRHFGWIEKKDIIGKVLNVN